MLKHIARATGLLALGLSLTLPTVSQAGKKESYTEREFSEILEKAAEDASKKVRASNIEAYKGVSSVEWLESNTWRANVQGWNGRYVDATGDLHEDGSGTVTIQTQPAVVVNMGNGFEFAYNSQVIFPYLYDRAIAQKHMKKTLTDWDWNKKYKDVEVEIGRNENSQIIVRAAYSYAGGVSEKDIRNRLKMLLHGSCAVTRLAMYSTAEAYDKAREEITKRKLTGLTKQEFLFLTEDGINEFEKEDGDGTEGHWEFTFQDRGMEMINYGNRAVVSYWREMPDGLTAANRDEILEKVQKYVGKKKVKKAKSMEALWYPGHEQYIWVKANFEFDGKIKGKDFDESYWKFKRGYSKMLEKEINKIIKKL